MSYERNDVVRQFERTIARYCGAPYGVAVESCSSALFLCCLHLKVKKVTIPKKTYFSVPFSIRHAGGTVKFKDMEWRGAYQLKPYPIIDSAMRLTKNMFCMENAFPGFLHCLSFQYSKHLPIGRGGMILTDNEVAAEWFRIMRNDGRREIPKQHDRVKLDGWNFYMTAEQAARGLELYYWRIHGKDHEDMEMTHGDISYV